MTSGSASERPAAVLEIETLATVVEFSEDGVVLVASDGTITFTNPAFCAMSRHDKSWIGRPASELSDVAIDLHHDDATGKDMPHLRGDGSKAVLRCRTRKVTTTQGPQTLLTLRDVTELRQLEYRNRLLSKMLDTLPMILWSLDAEGHYTTWDGKGTASLGSKPGELIGQNCLEQWKETSAYPNLLRALRGEEYAAALSLPPLDFEVFYIPQHDGSGAPSGMVGVALEVTAQKQTERELREKLEIIEQQQQALELFARFVDSAPIVIASVDAGGVFTHSDGNGLSSVGLKPGEVVGMNAFELYNDATIADAMTRALGGAESRLITNPAPEVYFDSWYLPLQREDGEVYGVNLIGLDVSDRMKSELALREKLDLIERQSATIRALATPIIKVWDEVLCLPVIGTVDSARTADMMEALLQAVVREQARYAVVDLTGVEVVDTATADHVIQLFKAANVLGVEGILCGIRPAVAQTVVALGVDLTQVRTMRTLQDALRYCIRMQEEGRRDEKQRARPPGLRRTK